MKTAINGSIMIAIALYLWAAFIHATFNPSQMTEENKLGFFACWTFLSGAWVFYSMVSNKK